MSAATVWRWLRGELLGIAIWLLFMWGLHLLFPLSGPRFRDALVGLALWIVFMLVRTGFGSLWRRRRSRNAHASDESTFIRP